MSNEQDVRYVYVNGKGTEDVSKDFGLRFFGNILALASAAYLIDALQISSVVFLILSALVFTVLNVILKPILVILTLPLTIITLGLFYPLINVLILNIVDFLMGDGFNLDGFWNLILTSLIVAIVNFAVTVLFSKKRRYDASSTTIHYK